MGGSCGSGSAGKAGGAINGDAFGTGDGAAHLPSSNLEPFSRMVADLDVSPRRDLNLCSAFAHVLADTMRTLTVMTCALLVSFGGVDALTADAVGSLVVSAIIALVAAYVLYEACVQALALRTGQPNHTSADGGALSGSRSAAAAVAAPDRHRAVGERERRFVVEGYRI